MSDYQYLIVGLGNPGSEHVAQRHNVGFMLIDRLHEDYGFGPWKSKNKGLFAQGNIDGQKCILLKPQTFMNLSGESAAPIAKFFKIQPENVICAYDELDLPFAKVKIKQSGGHGGHNGIKSMDKHMPSKEYLRVRLGIGHPGDKTKVHKYVLSNFAKDEQGKLDDLLYYGSKHFPLLLHDKKDDYMTRMAEATK